jgi:hypothetical protein
LRMRIFLSAAALALALTACGSPTDVETTANDAIATASALVPAGAEETVEALANDPTVEALVEEAEALVSDPEVQSTLDQAFSSIEQMTVTQGQDLALDALSTVPDVTNYKMTVVEAPEGAAAQPNTVIKEASNGNISLSAEEYGKYFTVPGDYKVRLDITTTGDRTASHEFTVTVP